LQLRTLENRIIVPTGAIRTKNQEHYVMIEENGVARMLKVDLGPSDQTQTVIEKGIQPGMHLIVAGQHLVADGSRVAVQN
jgi:multidrug efflux pump subunit AcrA (membrane-fusion protein)